MVNFAEYFASGISVIFAEIFYSVIGLIFIICGITVLKDKEMKTRITTAIFWFILAATFIVGPYIENKAIVGVLVVILSVLTGIKGVNQSKLDNPDPAETRKQADKLGYKVLLPALVLAVAAVLVATYWKAIGSNNAIGVSAILALAVAFVLTKTGFGDAAKEGQRLMQNVGATGILPQLLTALGAVFTAAGVGDVISGAVSAVIPEGNKFIAVAVYCIGMALFTMIMGNGFAAFSVITIGIGIPFVIGQGANPVIVGALGLTAGYCGTLMTPMAANFNIVPAALLETKSKYSIIKAQAPIAATMLVIHILLMYFLAF